MTTVVKIMKDRLLPWKPKLHIDFLHVAARDFQYTSSVGDGDSAAYHAISNKMVGNILFSSLDV